MADGEHTSEQAAAFRDREHVLKSLQHRIRWWRSESCSGGARPSRAPDVDGTLCRLGTQSKGFVLTNLLLVRNVYGRLHAALLIDQRDKHLNDKSVSWWPARSRGRSRGRGAGGTRPYRAL